MKKVLKKVIPKPVQEVIWRLIFERRLFPKNQNTFTPEEERRIFDAVKDDFTVVFDVGARNELSFYKMKPDCSFHLFEPNIKFVKQLRKQIAKFTNPDITVNQFGLSDKSADDLVYYEKSQSFMVNPTYPEGDKDTGVRYSLRRLDDYVKEKKIKKIDFLKIDAEGSDYGVILGGKKFIDAGKVTYIQFEYWDGVQKFVDALPDFNLYMMMEPVLLKAIDEQIKPMMTPKQKKINFHQSIIKLDSTLIDLIDNTIIPTGNGANILAIHKRIKESENKKLIFPL